MSDERDTPPGGPGLPERLFRDESGAALERAARLEDENRRLRAEIDRLSQAPVPPPDGTGTTDLRGPTTPAMRASDDRIIAGVVLGMVSLFAGATLAATSHHRPCPGHRSSGFNGVAVAMPGQPVQPVSRPLVISEARSDSTGTAAVDAKANCEQPYWNDQGIERLKPECLSTLTMPPTPQAVPVRAPAALPADNCNPPFTVDDVGRRHYKVACLR